MAPTRFSDPAKALAHAQTLYQQSIDHLRQAMQRFVAGEVFTDRVRACYPFVRIYTETVRGTGKHEGGLPSYGLSLLNICGCRRKERDEYSGMPEASKNNIKIKQ